ncbi:efflux RND transporter permease subunit [uncultured Cohaesibacter sp.]|uniref:efflux RND transporter permease subunit n=1 Tax=uncultured Cohaesibacter sp. TaxID=1002546 RepID=UPI002931C969|nr:efflux RND transporter permease subunit [uncultured Cohaesibacter sp.]
MEKKSRSLGISGNLAKKFISSPLTPLMLITAFALGIIALLMLPREEEPQISVPMVDIQVSADGLKAVDAVKLITEPLETIIKSINGIDHVYSNTYDDMVVVTARFLVGTDSDAAILRVHDKVNANLDQIPVGISQPLIVGRGIDDVAITVLTLSPQPNVAKNWTDSTLYNIADELRVELAKLDDIGLTYIVGGQTDQIRVEPDPEKLALYGVTLQQLVGKVQAANKSFMASSIREAGKSVPVAVGQTLHGVPDIGLLLLTTLDGRPVYVKDVATIVVGDSQQDHRVWNLKRQEGAEGFEKLPAVSLAIAKRKGANAVNIAHAILERVDQLKGEIIPEGINVDITRDYGETANEKANELLYHLGLATVSIVILVGLAIGIREGIVVFIVIPTTILLTLAAAYLMGYTINRVSLFALIFAIGILVDDAIVMIENISRHWAMKDDRSKIQAAIEGVAEVGNPTVIATLTVVAALLPMMFVSGMMGPYMSPIPAVASAAMVLSFFVAVMLTPWLMNLIGKQGHSEAEDGGILGRTYRIFAKPVLAGRGTAWTFLLIVGFATIASTFLIYTKHVTVKLLPFDNKSELQIVADLPEGSSMEDTDRLLNAAAHKLDGIEEIVSIQSHAGTAAPFGFNGLVRHYFFRSNPEQGDLQINLTSKEERHRTSHEIALEVRDLISDLAKPAGTVLKVVEVPPGPPVLSTLLAEIYGPTPEIRRAVATEVRKLFEEVPFIVDVDDSFGTPTTRARLRIDQDSLEYHNVDQGDVYDTISYYLNGQVVGYSHKGGGRRPVEIAVKPDKSDLTISERLLTIPVPQNEIPDERGVVELGDVIRVDREQASFPVFRHNGRSAEMVQADLAGDYEAPIYGMLAVQEKIDAHDWGDLPKPKIILNGQPKDDSEVALLWDGEWEVTWVTFRDMGAAFGIAILAIYALVVAQFHSFRVPLVVLTPIPLTLIGIMIGHWIFGAPFSATSMIGFIALAGIIVRNSILLVDFVGHEKGSGRPLKEVLLEAGSIRFKPIMLTALAAMIGAVVILADPIFQGLAISLLFGLASSTLLTVLVIPAIYIALKGTDRKV